jgi:hypothetical protein
MSGPVDTWDLASRGRRITQAMLDRGAKISAELGGKAQAAMKRLASIPEDDPDDGVVTEP